VSTRTDRTEGRATARSARSSTTTDPSVSPEVTVLLGDPSLPDGSKPGHRFTPEDLESIERVRAALGEVDDRTFHYITEHDQLIDRLRDAPPDLVLNFCDTGFRNDARREAHIAALLELLDIPYTGAGPTCLGLCYDKAAVRAIAADAGVPVPAEVLVEHGAAVEIDAGWPLPALIKPATGDGSVGITAASVVHSTDAVRLRIAHLRSSLPGRDLLVQQYLTGDEYAIALIGNPADGFDVLPPLRVDYAALPPDLPPILSYESKTDPSSPYWTQIRYVAADLDPDRRDALVRHAETLFRRLDCRDYARFDFRADTAGNIKLLEVNPNPAWCWDGKFNLMAGLAGWSYTRLLTQILRAAELRLER